MVKLIFFLIFEMAKLNFFLDLSNTETVVVLDLQSFYVYIAASTRGLNIVICSIETLSFQLKQVCQEVLNCESYSTNFVDFGLHAKQRRSEN